MYVYIDAPIVLYYISCMYRGIDVSQVKYARIENVCIYRRADSTGSAIYVCMHAYMYVLCMYYVCAPIGAPFRAPIANRRADRRAVWYG